MRATVVILMWLTILVMARAAEAAAIYRAKGADGEASFSDVAVPDAVAVELDVYRPTAEQTEQLREQLAQTVAVAAELEAARLVREQEYADQRAEAARWAASHVTIQEGEYPRVAGIESGFWFGNRYPHNRPHPRPEEPSEPPPPGSAPSPSISKPLPPPGARPGR